MVGRAREERDPRGARRRGHPRRRRSPAVGLTGQMHGLVLLDGRGEVLRPAILWNDQRTAASATRSASASGAKRWSRSPGNDALTGLHRPEDPLGRATSPRSRRGRARPAAEGLRAPAPHGEQPWTRPTARARCSSTCRARLVGARSLDGARDPTRLAAPRRYEGPEVTGAVTDEAAAATGLRAGHARDGGRRRPGGRRGGRGRGASRASSSLTLGTSGVVFATTDAPLSSPRGGSTPSATRCRDAGTSWA